jgi:hypothetical protein
MMGSTATSTSLQFATCGLPSQPCHARDNSTTAMGGLIASSAAATMVGHTRTTNQAAAMAAHRVSSCGATIQPDRQTLISPLFFLSPAAGNQGVILFLWVLLRWLFPGRHGWWNRKHSSSWLALARRNQRLVGSHTLSSVLPCSYECSTYAAGGNRWS